jgi:hypothetical protein
MKNEKPLYYLGLDGWGIIQNGNDRKLVYDPFGISGTGYYEALEMVGGSNDKKMDN